MTALSDIPTADHGQSVLSREAAPREV